MKPAAIALLITVTVFACKKKEFHNANEVECECAPPGIYTEWWMATISKPDGVKLDFSEIEPGSVHLELYRDNVFMGNEDLEVIESASGSALLVTHFNLLTEFGNSYYSMKYILRTEQGTSKPLTIRLDASSDECCTYPFLEGLFNEHGNRIYGIYDEYVENPQIHLH